MEDNGLAVIGVFLKVHYARVHFEMPAIFTEETLIDVHRHVSVYLVAQ